MKWDERIYALYKGETNITDGTILEIAEKTGKTISRVKYMTYPAYKKRFGENADRMILVPIEEDLEGLP